MVSVVIKGIDSPISCEVGDNLRKVLLGKDIFVNDPCSGKGVCGKCKIKVTAGRLSPISETEKCLLKEEEIAAGIRLSCLAEIPEDAKETALEIELLHRERRYSILTKGYVPAFKKDTFAGGYGISLDIGTTTVVAALIDMHTGAELTSISRINAQKHYGLDVLTRITYEYENPETGVKELQQAIVNSINEMIDDACLDAKVEKANISEIDVAANCTMMHMLLGVDATGIGRAPYKPVFLKAQTLLAEDIGICAGKHTVLYCLPSVSGYIGADITAGAYVCQLKKRAGNVLFIDIGTNGELVLVSGGKIRCCSCAAGPALEGMNISNGMCAAEGAVEDVNITEQGIYLKTIGHKEPAGICGSGILAVVKELLRTKIVKKTGVFMKKEKLDEADYRYPLIRLNGTKREFLLNKEPELFVTQGDIRQVQLAKGAILSGIMALLHQAGIDIKDLDKVLVAGQFGTHLSAEALTGTGILPETVIDKLEYVGNSSKAGAYMALISEQVKREIEQLAEQMEYVELAETENYERLFTECMIFPEP